MAIFRQSLLFVRQRTPYQIEGSSLARAKVAKIRTPFAEAQGAVRSAADLIRIMLILPVIFPEANGANFVATSTEQGLEPAAWAPI